jgi:hypothetical protein
MTVAVDSSSQMLLKTQTFYSDIIFFRLDKLSAAFTKA